MKKLHLIVILVLWGIFSALGENTYMFKHLDVGAGLSNNSVRAIIKDSKGFLWIATDAGLNRFDGYTFNTYQAIENDSLTLPDNCIFDIVEADNYRFWVKTGRGYAIYDGKTDRFYRDMSAVMKKMGSNGVPGEVYVDKRKEHIWIYVPGEGCYVYDTKHDTHRYMSFLTLGLPVAGLSDIDECSDGVLLVYDNGLLVCVDPVSLKMRWKKGDIPHDLGKNKYEEFTLFVDRDHDVWIYSTLGLWRYSCTSGQFEDNLIQNTIPVPTFVHSIVQDWTGKMWFGLDNQGIVTLDKRSGKCEHIISKDNSERSLPHNTVYDLFADPKGVIWVGTYKKGLASYSECIYKFALDAVGDITYIESDKSGNLLLGTNDSGLLMWNKDTNSETVYSLLNGKLGSNAVVSILPASDGKIWVGTFWGGLSCIDGNRVQTYRSTHSGLADDNVWSLAEDRNGNIWIATLGAGLQCLHPDNGRFDTYTTINSALSDNHLAALCLWNDDTLLVGTATKGIDRIILSDKKIESVNELKQFSVNQMLKDSRGLLWIAAREGLGIYDYNAGKLLPFSAPESIKGKPISAVVEDANGNIWFTVSSKIISVHITHEKNRAYEFGFDVYDKNDGLQNSDFNMRALKRLENGMILAGGLYGLNYFHPANIQYNRQIPHVMFTSMSLFNEPVNIGAKYDGRIILEESLNDIEEIKLKYSQNIISISFASDNYILPEKTQFKYQMEGFNKEWLTLPAGIHSVTFTNLAPGFYTLKVKAVNSDGVEGTEISSLHIRVLPPFWMTWWAYLFYALVVIAILFYARCWILKREREKFRIRQMEQEVAKNEEINNMKFRFFTNVSHELRTPLTLILSPLEGMLNEVSDARQKVRLQLMYRNAQRLLTLVNQLLDFRKGEMSRHQLSLSEGDVVTYIQSVCDSFLLMADKKHIQFSFFSGMEHFSMAFDADKLGKIVMNLLSNAFKFTPDGGRVSVILEVLEEGMEMLEIKVTDTGRGISDADKEHIFDRFYQADHKDGDDSVTGTGIGLSLVRDFVQLHDGDVKVFDNIGKGSVFVVEIPVRHVETLLGQSQQPIVTEEESVIMEGNMNLDTGTDREKFPLLLIVDDNEDFRTFMKSSLELQYRIELASNGKEAWEKMQASMPDLVISDVMMPEMDGNELCKLIKGDKRTLHIPVILLTAKQTTESKVEGLQTGADDYVTKPFNMTVLVLRIRKLIELSRYKQSTQNTIDPTPSEIVITSMDEKLIEKAIKYVEDNISRTDLSVEELSRELGMSRVHLYKKLLQITGKTPIEFIRVIRLKRAAQLLRESQLHVSEVAFEVGFNNPKYFSRYFKDEFGVLPSVYQEKEGK
ncbi:two-component regulator propeller domain-containing protein [uncultured Bacteroides sp.]|uniref:hybrid sensor histidine kinase/response regulator transcription factor n=1 Tax=uncultured Bacteroides sp. TaxID=162156 RepID=UPI00345D46DF